jgi:hypothetical protein
MLRLLALALALANAAFLAWSHGYGMAPAVQAEPQRMAQQLRPEAMRLLTMAEARQLDGSSPVAVTSTSTTVSAASECLQAGLFTDEQAAPLRARLQASLPTGSWLLEPGTEGGRWMVYMGKYTSAETLAVKRSELRRIGVPFELLTNPTFGPGLSLGRFESQANADTELGNLTQRGVRSARVVLERPETLGLQLTIPAADANLRSLLDGLKPQLAGKALLACR